MASVTVVMAGEDAKLRAAHEKLLKQLDNIRAKHENLTRVSKEAAARAQVEAERRKKLAEAERDYQKLQVEGTKLTQASLTPQERFNEKVQRLLQLREKEVISGQTVQRSMARYRAELAAEEQVIEQSTEAYQRRAAAERTAKQVQESLLTPTQRYRQSLRELITAQKEGTITAEQMRARQAQLRQEFLGNAGIWSTAKGQILGIAASYIGVQQAVNAVNTAIRDQIDLRKENAAITESIGASVASTIMNLTGLTFDEKKFAVQSARDIAKRTDFPRWEAIGEAIGQGFSASGDLQATLDAVEAAARLTATRPQALGDIASSALDVGRALKISDAERALGFILSAGSTARVEDPASLARALAPVLQAGSNLAPNQNAIQAGKDAAALFGVLSRFAVDFRGESTTTAGITLLQQMQKFFEENPQIRDPGTIRGRFATLAKSDLLPEFFSEGFGERRFQAAFRKLFDEADEASIEMAKSRQQIKASREVYVENVQQLTELNAITAATTRSAAAQGRQQREAANALDSFNTTMREDVIQALRQSRFDFGRAPVTNLAQRFNEFIGSTAAEQAAGATLYLSTGDPVTTAVGGFTALRERRRELTLARGRGVEGLDTDVENVTAAMKGLVETIQTLRRTADELTEDQQRRAEKFIETAERQINNYAARAQAVQANNGARQPGGGTPQFQGAVR